ncbi:MAG: hypothetical protein P8101_06245, partial [Candidatus Thiodiazotropha sp.]
TPRIEFQGHLSQEDKVTLGGQILKVAIAFDQLTNTGLSEAEAAAQLREQPEQYDPVLIETLMQGSKNRKLEILELPLDQLAPGLIIDQPIKSNAGALLLAKGQTLSQAMVFKLKSAVECKALNEQSIRVFRITQL